MNEKSPLVTLLVTTHNRPSYLKSCLDSISRQDNFVNVCQLIVVDSYSKSEMAKENERIVANHLVNGSIEVLYLRNTVVGGLTQSRNIGVIAARGDFIVQVDDDSLVSSDYVKNAYHYLIDGDVDLVVGKITPKFEDEDENCFELFEILKSEKYNGYIIEDWSVMDLGDEDISIPWNMAFSTNCAYRKDFYLTSGGIGPDGFSSDYFYWNGSGEHNYTKSARNIMYSSRMKSEHFIPKGRRTLEYLVGRSSFYGNGISFDQVRAGIRPVFSLAFAKTTMKMLSHCFRQFFNGRWVGNNRSFAYMKGYISHQFAANRCSVLREYIRQDNWLNFEFNRIFPMGRKSRTQWENSVNSK